MTVKAGKLTAHDAAALSLSCYQGGKLTVTTGDITSTGEDFRSNALYKAGGDGDESVTLPDYIYSTYNALMEAGWRFDDIDRMDMLGFLRVRAWKLHREKAEKAPKKAFIDQVWPDLR